MAKKSKVSKKLAKRESTPALTTIDPAVAIAPEPQAGDKRTHPSPDAHGFAPTADNWMSGKKEDVLRGNETLEDFDTYTTLQYAIMPCNDPKKLGKLYETLLGKELDLDACAKKAKKERDPDKDLRFLKEQLYLRASMAHAKKIAQRGSITEETAAKFQARLDAPYGKVKHIGKGGEPVRGYAKVTRPAGASNRPKTPTLLGFREGSNLGKAAQALIAAGKKGLTIAAFEEAAGDVQRSGIKRAIASGFIRMEEAEKRTDCKLFVV